MKTETMTTMDYAELEDLAKNTFGINYEYPVEEEADNNTNKKYNITQYEIEHFDWKEWAIFLEGRVKNARARRAYLLLTRLVMLAVVPAGNILIKISW